MDTLSVALLVAGSLLVLCCGYCCCLMPPVEDFWSRATQSLYGNRGPKPTKKVELQNDKRNNNNNGETNPSRRLGLPAWGPPRNVDPSSQASIPSSVSMSYMSNVDVVNPPSILGSRVPPMVPARQVRFEPEILAAETAVQDTYQATQDYILLNAEYNRMRDEIDQIEIDLCSATVYDQIGLKRRKRDLERQRERHASLLDSLSTAAAVSASLSASVSASQSAASVSTEPRRGGLSVVEESTDLANSEV